MTLFKHLLFPLVRANAHLSPEFLSAVELVVELTHDLGAKISFIAFEDHIPDIAAPWLVSQHQLVEIRTKDCQKVLKACVDVAQKKGVEADSDLVWGGGVAQIVTEAHQRRNDLVIKIAEHWKFLNIHRLSGDDMSLLRQSGVPVWLIPPAPLPSKKIKTLLVALDVAYGNRQLNLSMLAIAQNLSLLMNAKLHVVHSWLLAGEDYIKGSIAHIPEHSTAEAEKKVFLEHQKRLTQLLDEAQITSSTKQHLIRGKASEVICTLAKEMSVDLLIMGTHARQGFDRLMLGNTAENVAGSLDCSLIVVRPS